MTKKSRINYFLRTTGVFILQVLKLEIPNVALPFQQQYLLRKIKAVYLNCIIVLFFKLKHYFYLFAVFFHTKN